MALSYRIFSLTGQYIRHISTPVKWSIERHYTVRSLASSRSNIFNRQIETSNICILSKRFQPYSTQANNQNPPSEPKSGLLQRLKVMYRDYWYVTVPVHLVTSGMWFGSFYYAVRSGVDAVAILESLGVSEKILTPLRESGAGYVALALALYKVVTPLRYAVTIGVTTFAIKRLQTVGWIKPVPTKARLKEIYKERKDNFQDCRQHYQDQMKERRKTLLDEMRRYKREMRNKVKKM